MPIGRMDFADATLDLAGRESLSCVFTIDRDDFKRYRIDGQRQAGGSCPTAEPAAARACSNARRSARVWVRRGVRKERAVSAAPSASCSRRRRSAAGRGLARDRAWRGRGVRWSGSSRAASCSWPTWCARSRAGARPSVEFMRLASYGQKKESSGEVLLLGDVPRDFGGRAVLLVDDIVDTACPWTTASGCSPGATARGGPARSSTSRPGARSTSRSTSSASRSRRVRGRLRHRLRRAVPLPALHRQGGMRSP